MVLGIWLRRSTLDYRVIPLRVGVHLPQNIEKALKRLAVYVVNNMVSDPVEKTTKRYVTGRQEMLF